MNETAATLTVTATSTVDPSKKDTATVTMVDPNHDVTEKPQGPIDPAAGNNAVFAFGGDYANLAKILLNGKEMGQNPVSGTKAMLTYDGYPDDAGDAQSGSVVVTLYADFLKTLPNGVYTLTVEFNDGGVQTSGAVDFTITRSVTGATLDKTTASVTVGKTLQLTATLTPEDAANKGVTWKSSDTSIATVDENGLVKGVKAGKATITITTNDGESTATCEVTVTASSTPQTGDSGHLWLWMILGLASLLAGVGMFTLRKRQRKANA